tara:strand:- start:326181 stop:326576 length:396 start_codon:yes stop_codon:yes gene_type:complete
MENKKINLILTVTKVAIIAIGLLLMATSNFGAALQLTYFALAACALAAVGFGIYLFASNIKNNKGALIGLVGFVVVLLICYLTASSEVPNIKTVVSSGTTKMVGAGINAFYVLLVGVIGAIVAAEVRKVIK